MHRAKSASNLSNKSISQIKSIINNALGRQTINKKLGQNCQQNKTQKRIYNNVQRSQSTRSLYSHKCRKVSQKQIRNDRIFSTLTYSPSYNKNKNIKTDQLIKMKTKLLFNQKDYKFQRVNIQQGRKKNIFQTQIVKNSNHIKKQISKNKNFIKSYVWYHSLNYFLQSQEKQQNEQKIRYFSYKTVFNNQSKQQKNNLIGLLQNNILYIDPQKYQFVISFDKYHFSMKGQSQNQQKNIQQDNIKEKKYQKLQKIDLGSKKIQFIIIFPKGITSDLQQKKSKSKMKEEQISTSINIAKQIYSLKQDGVQKDETILKILARNLKAKIEQKSINNFEQDFFILLIRVNKKEKVNQQLVSKRIIDDYKRRFSKN